MFAVGWPFIRPIRSRFWEVSSTVPMSRTRTKEPSSRARTITSANCSAVVSRPSVVTGSVSWVPFGAGSRPSVPAGLVAFCSCTASRTSPTVMPSCAMRSGSSRIVMAKSSPPKTVASPTPLSRLSSSTT